MRFLLFVLLLLALGCGGGGGSSFTQPPPASTMPTASGDLAAFIKTQLLPSIRTVTGGGATADPADQLNEYILPTTDQLTAWRTVFQRMLAGNYSGAHTLVKTISTTYNVVEYTDSATARRYYVLMEGVPGSIPAAASHPSGVSITSSSDPTRRGWGTYIFAATPQRALSFSAPHPKDDLETADQAIDTFLDTGARSLLIAGADRDQNTALSPCDQASTPRPYLQADAAHNAESVFQMGFEEIYLSDSGLHHIQFHGNTVCAEDVFLSNGVIGPLPIWNALASNIVSASMAAAGGGAVLTVDVYDSPGDCSLRATTNTHLRFAAGIPHAQVCTGSTPTNASRFIHVEQLRIARRAPTDPLATPGRNRAVISTAIRQTFP